MTTGGCVGTRGGRFVYGKAKEKWILEIQDKKTKGGVDNGLLVKNGTKS